MGNRYDETKRLLEASRKIQWGSNEYKEPLSFLFEGETKVTDADIEEVQNNFINEVLAGMSSDVEFNELSSKKGVMQWSGYIKSLRLEWYYHMGDGVYMSCELLELNDESLDIIQKLYGHYEKWQQYFGTEESRADAEETSTAIEKFDKVEPEDSGDEDDLDLGDEGDDLDLGGEGDEDLEL